MERLSWKGQACSSLQQVLNVTDFAGEFEAKGIPKTLGIGNCVEPHAGPAIAVFAVVWPLTPVVFC